MGGISGGQRGFLLLTSDLGDPGRKPLTVAQFRELMRRWEQLPSQEPDRDVEERDFLSLGYGQGFARHIVELLEEEQRLDWYLSQAKKWDCLPITRASEQYPLILRKRLGTDSPGVLWARGDLTILDTPAISLVGSRDLLEPNRAFAEAVGRQAALQGLTLVSGNARGADKAAQNACLEAGGQVLCVVADSLPDHSPQENVLYISENSFDEAFSAQRAISRNRVIHALGRMTFVAQCTLGKGGTWDGTVKNLRFGWSSVACFRDGSEASAQLEQMGAYLVDIQDLNDLGALVQNEIKLI